MNENWSLVSSVMANMGAADYVDVWQELVQLHREEGLPDEDDPLKLNQWIADVATYSLVALTSLQVGPFQQVGDDWMQWARGSIVHLSDRMLVDPLDERYPLQKAVIAGGCPWEKARLERYTALWQKCFPSTEPCSPFSVEEKPLLPSKDYLIANQLIAWVGRLPAALQGQRQSQQMPPQQSRAVASLTLEEAEGELGEYTVRAFDACARWQGKSLSLVVDEEAMAGQLGDILTGYGQQLDEQSLR